MKREFSCCSDFNSESWELFKEQLRRITDALLVCSKGLKGSMNQPFVPNLIRIMVYQESCVCQQIIWPARYLSRIFLAFESPSPLPLSVLQPGVPLMMSSRSAPLDTSAPQPHGRSPVELESSWKCCVTQRLRAA